MHARSRTIAVDGDEKTHEKQAVVCVNEFSEEMRSIAHPNAG